ncbi:hypothetical protein GCM10023172_01230 [Hymenobacter ginsengisoli]|uniref:Uncharacterized protein n=1 Tax=Hymenobacter ginsengisoli TaxID=1051626 RepID=A0ABP8PX62_9BACT|nr:MULTISPECIES: hypothetical protein [unclassified Hymenobacter]
MPTLFCPPGRWLALLMLALVAQPALAHPMPSSVVLLTVHAHRIEAAVQVPLGELQPAFGQAVGDSATQLVPRLGPELRASPT